jgi:hypothetical protein
VIHTTHYETRDGKTYRVSNTDGASLDENPKKRAKPLHKETAAQDGAAPQEGV